MNTKHRYQKTLKFYRDFPWLWAVCSECGVHLDISACSLKREVLKSEPGPSKKWWVMYERFHKRELRRLDVDGEREVYQLIIDQVRRMSAGVLVMYIVSSEQLDSFNKKIEIHRLPGSGVRADQLVQLL